MVWMRVVVAALLLASVAQGQTIIPRELGVQAATESCGAGCSTGVKGGAFNPNGATRLVVVADRTGGAAMTTELEQSVDLGTTWVSVGTVSTDPGRIVEDHPTGLYRINVTTCTSCTYSITWRWSRQRIR